MTDDTFCFEHCIVTVLTDVTTWATTPSKTNIEPCGCDPSLLQ